MNLKEELNRLDRESIDNNTKYYDLKNLFEAIILTDEEKKELAKLIKDKEDPEVIYDNLAKKYGHDLSDLEIEEDYVHKTDEHTFNPLATAATLEVGDKVYDSTGEKVLEIVDKQMPNNWSVMLTIKDVATGDTWIQHSGHLALFELVVEGDHAEEVPEDIDIQFYPIDELTEGITTDGLKLPTNSKQVNSYVWRKIRPHDELTEDSSRFWIFHISISNGADAVLVNKVEDIPDNATYRFSLLDMDLYLNDDDYTWYVLDNSISDEELTEDNNSHFPKYIKTKDGYVGKFSYLDFNEFPVYRFENGERVADEYELQHGSNNIEDLKENKQLNEGPGAGYSVKGTINNTKINSMQNMTIREESDGYVFDIELDADADFDDVSFYSYYYGDEINSTKIKISKVSIYGGTDDTPLKESEIISSINGTKIGVWIGAGYTHTTFDGNIEAYEDTSEINSRFDDILEIEFDLTDKNAIEFIDGAVSGDNISTDYAVILNNDIENIFPTQEQAINYAEEIGADKVKVLYTITKFIANDFDVIEEFGDTVWDGEYLESLNEDWRTGTFTREDLQSYRNDQIQKVLLVANSIKFMIRKHPEYSEIFFNLIDDLIDHLEDVKKESDMNEALVDEDKWTKEVLDILKTVLDKADDIRYEMKYATRGSRIKVSDINGLVSWLNDFNEDIEKASKELEERNDELTNGPQEENGQEENNNENQ